MATPSNIGSNACDVRVRSGSEYHTVAGGSSPASMELVDQRLKFFFVAFPPCTNEGPSTLRS